MAHRRGSFRGRGISESQRRKKTWISVKTATGGSGSLASAFTTANIMETPVTTASAGSFGTDIFALVSDPVVEQGEEASTLPEECTILRARGSLLFPKNLAAAGPIIEDNYSWGFGVTDIRSIQGFSAPGAIIDADWDGWMFLRQSGVSPVDSMGTMVDVKAMRKIKNGDALFFSAQAVNGGSTITPAGQFLFDLRLLILLP